MKKSSFVEGTAIATIAIILVKLAGVLYVIPFYATIGEQGSALYGYAYNIYQIFLNISSAGIPLAMSKLINEYDSLGMKDAKVRAFSQGKKIISLLAAFAFAILFLFAKEIAILIVGSLKSGNTIEDVAYVIRCISFAILVIPYLSITKGFLQGHKIIAPSSISQIIEQMVRIFIILLGSYLAIKVFDLGVTKAVGIAVSGAFVGGLVAYIYLLFKINKNKKQLNLIGENKKDNISNQDIRKKIIYYAVPFVINNIITSIYNFTNMVINLRVLTFLGYDGHTAELITSILSTWSVKLNMIVGAFATGMAISLIPNIVSSFVKKDYKEVNNKFNKAIQIILIISIPATIGLSLLSIPIWTMFYGASEYGPLLFKFNIFTVLVNNLFLVTNVSLQSMNKFKVFYKCTAIGFIINLILIVPCILLLNLFGCAYYGSIIATIVGYSISLFIALRSLSKEDCINYKSTLIMLKKIILPTLLMIIIVLIFKFFLPFENLTRIKSLLYIIICALCGGGSFILITYKNGILVSVFGKDFINKILKKLTLGKLNIK